MIGRALILFAVLGTSALEAQKLPRVRISTSMGEIIAEIDTVHAPVTGNNFMRYVDAGFYKGGTFGRTVRADNQPTDSVKIGVIQASGSRERNGEQYPAIPLERTKDTGLSHKDGELSMARGGPDTARSSFFICIGDWPALDFGGHRNIDGQGFAAFGHVIRGMDVAKKIQAAPANAQQIAPPIAIDSVTRVR